MTTVEIKGWIFYEKSRYQTEFSYAFAPYESDKFCRAGDVCIRVCEHTIRVEVPEGFDPTAEHVAQLERSKEQLRAEFNAKIKAINDALSELKALEFTPAEVSA